MRAHFLLLGIACLAAAATAADPLPATPAASPTMLAPDAPTQAVRYVSPGQARRATLLAQRTLSASGQFFVYSKDAAARSRIASVAEELKIHVLQLLGEGDHWQEKRNPILITLDTAAAPTQVRPPVEFSLFQNDAGFKIEIDVRLGSDPAPVNLQKHLIRAVLLELAYRDQPQLLKPGTPYVEAPWWLVEGAIQLFQRRGGVAEIDLFKQIINLNRLPPIGKFLAGQPGDFAGTAVEAMDQACAMCLVQLLIEQPGGRASLGKLLRHWPQNYLDPVASLITEYPGLGANEGSVQKWWTLNLARFSVADRFQGFSSAETESKLASLWGIEVPSDDSPSRQTFALADYAKALKLRAGRAAFTEKRNAVAELSTRASAVYRPLIAEYGEILALLAQGKTRGLRERIERLEQLRTDLHQRGVRISDYLNWFEATQMETSSGKFESYLKAAQEIAHPPPRTDPISRYLDGIAAEN